jgi:hypothetical protein
MKAGVSGAAGGGIYFATAPHLTHHTAIKHGHILKAKVRLGNAKEIPHPGDSRVDWMTLLSEGYDSVIIHRTGTDEYVFYSTGQVSELADHGPCTGPHHQCTCRIRRRLVRAHRPIVDSLIRTRCTWQKLMGQGCDRRMGVCVGGEVAGGGR